MIERRENDSGRRTAEQPAPRRRPGTIRTVRAVTPPPNPRVVPPLLPVLLPVVVAAIATGVLFAWWFPATPAGAVAPAARFTDVTVEAGLGAWAAPESADAPTTLGGGVACFDFDGDGHDDLLLVGGAPWPWEEGMAKRISRGSLALFHNDGTGRFRDVTALAGLNLEVQGMGAAAGDYDGDGRVDVFVTGVGANHLFRNLGRGRFEDVTEAAGVTAPENTWSTGAAWIDYDGDRRLDLVVAHYARWSREVELRMAFTVANVGHSYGAPTGFVGVFPSVYRNLGDGKFALVPNGAGLRDVDRQTGFPVAKTLAVVPVEANGDGRPDLLFSYHTQEGALFLNAGDGRFHRWTEREDRRREGVSAGLASAGSLSLAPETDSDGTLGAWRRMAAAGSDEEGFVALERKLGAALLDYDLDGRLDVLSGRGRAEVDTNRFDGGRAVARTPELWWNAGGRWVSAPPAAEAALAGVAARGVAVADFDGDGDSDVVAAQTGGGPRLWRNDQRAGWPWLQVSLTGAVGARVEVHTPRRVHVQTALPAMGYLAQSSSVLTFGLGEDARVRKVVVVWPGGARQELRPESVNRRIVVIEPR